MKKIIAKMLLLSDLHQLSVPVGKQLGQGAKWWQRLGECIIFNTWKRWNLEFALPRMRRKIMRMTSGKDKIVFDYQIFNGDVIEGQYTEQGMIARSDHREIRRTINTMPSGVRFEETFVVPGNMEIGYKLPFSSDPHGGISLYSLECFDDIVGPLWSTHAVGESYFLFLCSSLMIHGTEHLSFADQHWVEKFRERQELFIMLTLEAIPEGKSVFVFMHDPDAVMVFHRYIRDFCYMYNKNMTIFCGHMHTEYSLKVYKLLGRIANSKWARVLPRKVRNWARGNDIRMQMFEKYNLQIIPAPGGMLGIGGGFMVLNLFEDGQYELERHDLRI